MPYVELARLYDPDRIHHQYQLFAGALGIKMDDQAWYEKAAERRDAFAKKYRGKRFVVGEMANANPFELAAALVRMGMEVPMIVSNLTEAEFPYIRQLAEESPDTEIYTGISPSMVHFQAPDNIDAAIGKDAAAYCPDAAGVEWNGEKQPYGHKGVIDLLDALDQALQEGGHDAQERNEKTFYGSALRGEGADKRAASAEDQQA
jgi:nitrogenase molybdenum-cofactor synthesis protein NifE